MSFSVPGTIRRRLTSARSRIASSRFRFRRGGGGRRNSCRARVASIMSRAFSAKRHFFLFLGLRPRPGVWPFFPVAGADFFRRRLWVPDPRGGLNGGVAIELEVSHI